MRGGRLHALYEVFKDQIFHDLTTQDFADAFAQMLAYGLFLSRLNAGANEVVTLENVRRHIPGSFRLIRELVRFLEEMNEPVYFGTRWVVEEIMSIVYGLDLASIHEDLSFRQRNPARAANCRWTKSPISARWRAASPSPSRRWRLSIQPAKLPLRTGDNPRAQGDRRARRC